MDWKEKLKKFVAEKEENKKQPELTEEERTANELDRFSELYTKWKSGSSSESESYKSIPRFYYRLPAEDEVLLQKLREESRAVFLQRRSRYTLKKKYIGAKLTQFSIAFGLCSCLLDCRL